MDRVGANFAGVVDQIHNKLKANAVPVQLPLGCEDGFAGVIDLVRLKTYHYHDETLGAEYHEEDIPEDYRAEVEEYRERLIEAAAETSEEFLELYLANGTLEVEQILQGLRTGTIGGSIVPVLCGSAFKNKGVQPLLDAVVDFLPSPLDVPPIEGFLPEGAKGSTRRSANDDEPFAALVFKIMTDPFVGRLSFIRIYSGHLATGSSVVNAVTGKSDRVGRLLKMHANKREEIDEVFAGDICALVGLRNAGTGETLCDRKHPIVLEAMHFPEPVIAVAIEPRTKADQDNLGPALEKLTQEDPTFRVHVDEETGQTIISGMGELHLEIIVDRLTREYKIGAKVGRPQVAYREAVTKEAEGEGLFVRQTGGRGQYGHAKIRIWPLADGSDFVFVNEIKQGAIPREFISPIEVGIREAMERGVLAGYPLMGVGAALYDGSYHDVDSSEVAFKVAGSMALLDAARRAGPVIMEPVMEVEAVTPEEYLGDVIGDLNRRRGRVLGMENRAGYQVATVQVPLSEMFGYATDLRSQSQGRATYSMQFDHYNQVPQQVADQIVARATGMTA